MQGFRIHVCGNCWNQWCKGKTYKEYPDWLKYLFNYSWTQRKRATAPDREFTTDQPIKSTVTMRLYEGGTTDPSVL